MDGKYLRLESRNREGEAVAQTLFAYDPVEGVYHSYTFSRHLEMPQEATGRIENGSLVMVRRPAPSRQGSIGLFQIRRDETSLPRFDIVPAGSAAQQAGIRPGDVIVAVDGKSLSDVPHEQHRPLLRGPIGSTVRITVSRNGRTRDYTLTRKASSFVPHRDTYSPRQGGGFVLSVEVQDEGRYRKIWELDTKAPLIADGTAKP